MLSVILWTFAGLNIIGAIFAYEDSEGRWLVLHTFAALVCGYAGFVAT